MTDNHAGFFLSVGVLLTDKKRHCGEKELDDSENHFILTSRCAVLTSRRTRRTRVATVAGFVRHASRSWGEKYDECVAPQCPEAETLWRRKTLKCNFTFVLFAKNVLADNQNFLRPFLRWAGGKQNIVKYLLENLPSENEIENYWEPFLGAGSLFFANGFTKACLSDVNVHLINAFKQIKADPRAVYNRLVYHKKHFTVDYYYQLRNAYNKQLNENTREQAVRFIFLVHTCFNGIYRVNQKGEYNVPIGKLEPSLPTLNHLEKVSKKLQPVELSSHSYENILSSLKKRDFVYLDPPYPKLDYKEQFQQFTIDRFSEAHQEELATFAERASKKGCFVMISNSKVPLIERLYENWNIVEVPVIRYVSCKKERKKISELIIKNY